MAEVEFEDREAHEAFNAATEALARFSFDAREFAGISVLEDVLEEKLRDMPNPTARDAGIALRSTTDDERSFVLVAFTPAAGKDFDRLWDFATAVSTGGDDSDVVRVIR